MSRGGPAQRNQADRDDQPSRLREDQDHLRGDDQLSHLGEGPVSRQG